MVYDASLLTAHSNDGRERVPLIDQTKRVPESKQPRVKEQRATKRKETEESGKAS